MSKRDEVFETFGPKLLEAWFEMTLEEINILRAQAGLGPRTLIQLYTQLMNRHSNLSDYDWMDHV